MWIHGISVCGMYFYVIHLLPSHSVHLNQMIIFIWIVIISKIIEASCFWIAVSSPFAWCSYLVTHEGHVACVPFSFYFKSLSNYCFPSRFWIVLHGPIHMPFGDLAQLSFAEAGGWLPGFNCQIPWFNLRHLCLLPGYVWLLADNQL